MSGDGVINVEPSTAVLAITDSTEPECGRQLYYAKLQTCLCNSTAPIKVGYTETSYTVSEGEGVIVCVEITSHPVNRPPRPFSLTLMTENGTAGIIIIFPYANVCILHTVTICVEIVT